MTIKNAELKAILAEVRADFSQGIQSLAKAEAPAKDEKEESKKEDSAKEVEKAEAKPEEKEESKKEESEKPMEKDEMAPEAPAEEAPAEPAEEEFMSEEELVAAYQELSPEELAMHLEAAMKAKAMHAPAEAPMDEMAPEAPAEEMEKAKVDEGKSPSVKAAARDARSFGDMKANIQGVHKPVLSGDHQGTSAAGSAVRGNRLEAAKQKHVAVREEQAAMKSEEESQFETLQKAIDNKDAKIEELSKSLAEVRAMLDKPIKKAVTQVSQLAKSQTQEVPSVSYVQAMGLIKQLSADPAKLEKSERKLIVDFYDRKITADKLAPLFEKYFNQ